MPSTEHVPGCVTTALVAWQETGDERALESLIAAASAEVERLAALRLRRCGVVDQSAVDDTLSLVFDHLRRLRGTAPGERAVAACNATRPAGGRHGDAGKAYLTWLVRNRALDVARRRQRWTKRRESLTREAVLRTRWFIPHDARDEEDDRRARFHAAVARLEPRLHTVVELLLEGKSQAVIAHTLDVCEGTVSRLRARAIAALKRLMD